MPLTIRQIKGNLVDMALPSSSSASSSRTPVILAHACNCKGQANAGVAKALKSAFPHAVREYTDYCKANADEEIVGSTVMSTISGGGDGDGVGEGHYCYLANLLTSKDYGRRKDTPEVIARQTEEALRDLRHWIERRPWQQEMPAAAAAAPAAAPAATPMEKTEKTKTEKTGEKVQVFSNQMNSGFFGVDWPATLGLIQKVFADTAVDMEWTVVVLE